MSQIAAGAAAGSAGGPWGAVIGGALGLGGALLGAKGASDQAQAQIDAARENRAFDENQASLAALQKALLYYGPQGLDIWKRFTPKDQQDKILGTKGTPAQTLNPAGANGDVTAIDNKIEAILGKGWASKVTGLGGPNGAGMTPANIVLYATGKNDRTKTLELENLLGQKSLIQQANGQPIDIPAIGPVKGLLNEEDLKGFGPGLISGYEDFANKSASDSSGAMDRYNADTNTLDSQARDLETMVRKYGLGQIDRIKRDTATALTNANRAATANLARRGLLASTAATDAIRGNTRDITRAGMDATANAEDQILGVRTGVAQNRLGIVGQRLAGRGNLDQSNIDRNNQIRLGVLNTRLGTLDTIAPSGTLINKSQSYFPGVSPSGAASGVLGQVGVGAGSTLLGASLADYFKRKAG